MNTILTHKTTTPLGSMLMCATEKGICLLEFVGSRRIEREQQDLSRLLNARFAVGKNRHIGQAEQELHAYFAGVAAGFTVALDMPGTPFQQRVWQALAALPFGKTTHYQALAESIGQPAAVRALPPRYRQRRLAHRLRRRPATQTMAVGTRAGRKTAAVGFVFRRMSAPAWKNPCKNEKSPINQN